MPYRPGIISSGEDYVGETAALNRKLRKTKGARVPSLYHFDSEEELFHVDKELETARDSDDIIINKRKRYQAYWGAVKRMEMLTHLDHYEECVPTTQRDWSCGICRCGNSKFKCLCDEGKKMLSPMRIAFQNSYIAWQVRNLVYDINSHQYLPKTTPIAAPDWRDLDWNV